MYFGSVRFFRHLILLVMALLIAVPVYLAVHFAVRCRDLEAQMTHAGNVASKGQTDSAQLLPQISALISGSISQQLPEFQKRIDSSVSKQVDALRQQLRGDVTGHMAEIKADIQKDLKKTLSEQVSTLTSKQSTMQQQLSSDIKNQTNAIALKLEKKLDAMSIDMMMHINETLSDQISLLIRRIDPPKTTGSKG